ncbi:23S rRNA pseudouridine(2605) synthase RluB [Arenimonas sp.]|uniref:23S rRNA pseudouridine(2605) synthase RluB n=1 Tax=Arenimonas sp. TaxID=1872635 RepID=UPI0039E23C00
MSDSKTKKTLSLKSKGEETAGKIEERLHKVLAQAGLGSRRALEERIASGLVRVNGETARTGQSVSGGDRIEIDGKTFVTSTLTEPASVLIYNKPEGEVTTREDPEGRPTIFESLPRLKGARWIAVGRLDINTTGLLLLTTDGELANALMHPSSEVEREYICRIHGEVPDNIVDRLARGVALDDGPAKFDKIERIGSSDSHAWFQVVLSEGRNREVRRLWESQGYQVSRLKRVRYGDVTLPRLLKRGHCVEMEAEQVEALRKHFGLENQAPVLTLQPVIGQRKSRPMEIRVGKDRHQASYVNGHVNDEARELRRFDHVREDKPRGRGRGKPGGGYKGKGGKPFAGPMGADAPYREGQAPRPPRGGKPGFKGKKPFAGPRDDNFGNRIDDAPRARKPFGEQRGPRPHGQGERPFGERNERGPRGQAPGGFKGKPRGPNPAHGAGGNSAEFRSWYVPDGVETGSKVAPPRHARGPKPQGQRGPRPQGDGPYQNRGPRPQGDRPQHGRGPRPQGEGPHQNRGPRPQGDGPYQNRGPRPQGDRPQQNRGPRKPGGAPGPYRKRPDGLPSDD